MKPHLWTILILTIILNACSEKATEEPPPETATNASGVKLVVLGTTQDAGSPQIGCDKSCCKDLFDNPDHDRKVVSLGVIDADAKKSFLFEATPDMVAQCKQLKTFSATDKEIPDGVFLTHAHIGHYTGLMYFGKEALNAKEVPVYVMPKMKKFLLENGPWSQLITNENISLKGINNKFKITLSDEVIVSPYLVPHRDEYSETVGYTITGPEKSALFIPDIDKWNKWDKDIIEEIKSVDYAFLDATFYDGEELNNRDLSEIPHPFVVESMEKFKDLPAEEKSKIYFIHFNHTNPILNAESKQAKEVIKNGFNIAKINTVLPL